MSDILRNTENDLAFLKTLVEGDHRAPASFGAIYAMTGVVYGSQAVFGWLQIVRAVELAPNASALVHLSFTVVYLIALVIMITHYARAGQPMGGVTARAFSAAFASVGIAALTMVAVLGAVAWRLNNPGVFLLMPAMAFVLQGAAWLVATMVRRRLWLGAIATGWFVAAIAVALTLNSAAYVLVIGLAMLLLMIVPGVLIVRDAHAR